jgi:hypothetical protein
MALTKKVNGETVTLSKQEEKAVREKWAAEDARAAEHEALYGYQDKRRAEYPSIQDQLDSIFHNGIEGWKAEIQIIKDKYPKPE